MIALTARLNERDDTIVNLQSECDALESINKDTDSDNKRKNHRVAVLERLLENNNIEVPKEDLDDDGSSNSRNGTRGKYLPYSSNGLIPENILLSNFDDVQTEFMTAEQKIEELNSILTQKENEIEVLQCSNQSNTVNLMEEKM